MIFKFSYSLFIFFIFFTSCSSKSNDPDETTTPKVETPSIVTISQKKLFVDGNRYYIKGICYGRNGYFNYQQDIPMMVEANINTVRVYAQIFDRAELDAYHSAGIKIIMQVDYNGNYEAYVRDYMTHPAVLMWEVGNENNYHPDWFGGNLNNWYRTLEEVATKIKTIDTNHPIATAHGEVPTAIALNSCPSVDIWGMNLYRWDNNIPAIEAFIALSEKPLYISEAGADSYDSRSIDLLKIFYLVFCLKAMFVWALHYFLSVMNGGKLVTQANKTQVVKHLIAGVCLMMVLQMRNIGVL